eukprot:CAMPEP_0169153752 /NCGR_PEP_ID=MMETSP1015-20121227/52303_1 /TAXON_ID=342587 /ORGANISM="Karlodinium micrum, Strain CCMP2283" /LENGTH=72 /DNA_ID=CAMNT_0009223811 /DNA_START=206 /DNA_END=424 /DNA_ORIENTATION=-
MPADAANQHYAEEMQLQTSSPLAMTCARSNRSHKLPEALPYRRNQMASQVCRQFHHQIPMCIPLLFLYAPRP